MSTSDSVSFEERTGFESSNGTSSAMSTSEMNSSLMSIEVALKLSVSGTCGSCFTDIVSLAMSQGSLSLEFSESNKLRGTDTCFG